MRLNQRRSEHEIILQSLVYFVPIRPNVTLKRWQTQSTLAVWTPSAGRIKVPAFFETDGGSKPRLLWWLTGHPLSIDRYPAYIVHDWLYITQPVSRKQADKALYEVMVILDVPVWKCYVEYIGVRLGGWIGWRRHAKI